MLGAGFLLGSLRSDASDPSSPHATPSELEGAEGVASVEVAPMLQGHAEPGSDKVVAAIESVPALSAKKAAGAISGRVATSKGEPIAGAEVRVRPPDRPPPGGWPALYQQSTEALIRYMIASQKYRRQHLQVASTNADGSFRLTGLLEGTYRVQASHPDFTIRASTHQNSHAAKAGDTIEFLAVPVTGVRLDLQSPDGSKLERVHVRFRNGQGADRGTGWRADDGLVQVAPGTWTMTVVAGADGQWASRAIEVDVPARGVLGPISVALHERPRIHVALDFGAQGPRPLTIRYTRVPTGFEAHPSQLDRRLQDAKNHAFAPSFVEDGDPTVTINAEALEAGSYLVVAYEDSKVSAHGVVAFEGSPTTMNLLVPERDREARVTVRVRGPTKEIPGGELRGSVYVKQGYSYRASALVLDAEGDGTYSFPLPKKGGEADSMLTLVLRVPGWGLAWDSRRGDAETDLAIEFVEPASIEAQVEGIRGSIYEGVAAVSLLPMDADVPNSSSAREFVPLDSGGAGRLSSLQPGTYLVMLSPGDRYKSMYLTAEKRAIVSGANVVRMSMPELGTVVVRGKPGGSVWLRRQSQPDATRLGMRTWQEHRTVGVDGAATFTGVPAGTYALSGGGKRQQVEIRGDAEFTLGD